MCAVSIRRSDQDEGIKHGIVLKLIGLMVFLQCFQYKNTDFVPVLEVGLTVTPDRFIFIVILLLAIWKYMSGEFQYTGLGKIGWCALIVACVSTISTATVGAGSRTLYRLFDFSYAPLAIFLLVKSIPHSRSKIKAVLILYLVVGSYLAFNGVFEHFEILHSLVWPKYIMDPSVGIQYGRTRGSFVSSEMLGMALIVCFLFYALYATRMDGFKLYWAYFMLLISAGVIYTTNQRSAWVSFGMCLFVLAVTRTALKSVARVLLGVILLAFVLGVGSHFSLWETTLFSKRQETVDYRKANFETALEMGMANPIFGIGYGNFSTEWLKYFRPQEGVGIRDLKDGNHNTFLGIFSELGLVGLIPYCLMIYFMCGLGVRAYNNQVGFDKSFAMVACLILLTYVISGNFSDHRVKPFYNSTLFLVFGCIAAMNLPEKRRRST